VVAASASGSACAGSTRFVRERSNGVDPCAQDELASESNTGWWAAKALVRLRRARVLIER